MAAVPEFAAPNRTTFSRSVIPDLYKQKVWHVKSKLRSCFMGIMKCYSVTTDGWTSHSGNSYLSMMCRALGVNFTDCNYTLACWNVLQGCTAGNLCAFLQSIYLERNLPKDLPVFMLMIMQETLLQWLRSASHVPGSLALPIHCNYALRMLKRAIWISWHLFLSKVIG